MGPNRGSRHKDLDTRQNYLKNNFSVTFFTPCLLSFTHECTKVTTSSSNPSARSFAASKS